MKTGTIVLTPFPFTDLSINKLRPAVVISPVTPNSSDVIVAFISSVVPSRINTCDYVFSDSHSDFRISGLKNHPFLKWIN